jgi:hypothetical protein
MKRENGIRSLSREFIDAAPRNSLESYLAWVKRDRPSAKHENKGGSSTFKLTAALV